MMNRMKVLMAVVVVVAEAFRATNFWQYYEKHWKYEHRRKEKRGEVETGCGMG